MVGEPRSGLLAEDNAESAEFLCGVAAECINDALLVLEHVQIDCKADLQHILSCLIARGTVDRSSLEPTQSLKSGFGESSHELSPAAQEIVDGYITSMMEDSLAAPRGSRAAKLALRRSEAAPVRQHATLLLMEALSILGDIEDPETISHIQIAIDRARVMDEPREAARPYIPDHDLN